MSKEDYGYVTPFVIKIRRNCLSRKPFNSRLLVAAVCFLPVRLLPESPSPPESYGMSLSNTLACRTVLFACQLLVVVVILLLR
jgi:hypothetical protein